mgnify:CR=1 FL=1
MNPIHSDREFAAAIAVGLCMVLLVVVLILEVLI